MQIDSITIERFAGLPAQTIAFGSGLNLAQANNESGKSRICAFFRFIFYGFSDKADRDRYLPWGEDTACGTLTLTADDGQSYRIERTVNRAGKGSVKVLSLPDGTELPKTPEPWERFLRVPEEVFLRSAYVGQTTTGQGNDGMQVGGDKARAAIDNLLATGDTDTDVNRAMKKLEALRTTLRYKRGTGGRLWELEQEIGEAQVALQTARDQQVEQARAEANCAAAEETVRSYTRDLAALEERLHFAEEGELRRSYQTIAAHENALSAAVAHQAKLTAEQNVMGELPTEATLSTLRELLSQVRFAEETLARESESARSAAEAEAAVTARESAEGLTLQKEIEALQATSAASKEAVALCISENADLVVKKRILRQTSPYGFLRSPLFFIAILLFLSGVIAYPLLPSNACLAAVGVIVGVVGMAAAVVLARISAMKARASLRKEVIAQKTDRLSTLESAACARLAEKNRRESELSTRALMKQGAETARDALLARYGKQNTETALSELEQAVFALRSADEEVRRRKTVLESAKQMLDYDPVLAAELASTPFDMAEFDARCAAGERADVLKAKLAEGNAALKEAIALREQARLEFTKCRAVSLDPAAEESKLAEKQEKYARLSAQYLAIVRAIEALDAAKFRLRRDLSPRLSEEARKLFSAVTADRHTTLTVLPELNMTYTEPETHPLDTLSAGTQDLAYISLRLALLRVLGQTHLPVFFDESFARIDDTRLQVLLAILAEAAKTGTQIFLFTSQTREGMLLRKIAPVTEIPFGV